MKFIPIPDLPGEEWKLVEGFEDIYLISNLGRVKSLYRMVPHSFYGLRSTPEKILKPQVNTRSYTQDKILRPAKVNLCDEGISKSYVISHLVWRAFLWEPPRNIGHRDNDPLNNALSNLYDIDDPYEKEMIQKKLPCSLHESYSQGI